VHRETPARAINVVTKREVLVERMRARNVVDSMCLHRDRESYKARGNAPLNEPPIEHASQLAFFFHRFAFLILPPYCSITVIVAAMINPVTQESLKVAP